MEEERMLAAAGFQMKLANTRERMKKAEALAQRKFTKVPYGDGSVRYVYADAKYCKCIYAGSEQAYGRYWKMAMRNGHRHGRGRRCDGTGSLRRLLGLGSMGTVAVRMIPDAGRAPS